MKEFCKEIFKRTQKIVTSFIEEIKQWIKSLLGYFVCFN